MAAVICSVNHSALHGRIKKFCEVYGLAEETYKKVQPIILKIDNKVHNEFRYCSRALRELLEELSHEGFTEQESLDKLQRAEHAIKNALNDSVDLVVGYAITSIREMAEIDTGKELVTYIHDLPLISKALQELSRKIEESRNDSGSRLEIYSEIIKSDEFRRAIEFSQNAEIIKNTIITDYGRLVRDARRFFISTSITIFGIFITLIGVIEKLPEFISYLARFFPGLNKYLSSTYS